MCIEYLKQYLVRNQSLFWPLISRLKPFRCCDIHNKAHFVGCTIKDKGTGNQLIIEEGSSVSFCTFCFSGNNNYVIIKKNAVISSGVFFLEDDNNEITIGEGTTFTGRTELIAVEGTRITIGHDCMFAYGIVIRTGDHHTILNAHGKRMNPSKDITIGNHVWVGQNAYLLKGVTLADGCIAGACSVVTKGSESKSVILAGNPAKVIQTDVSWDRERHP